MKDIYTEMDIARIYLVLGMACNFSCKYCYERNRYCENSTLNNNIIEYLKNISNMQPKEKKPIHLIFWGGEPLMYMEYIKKIVLSLQGYNFTYGLVSNGSLITDDMVDFFNEYKFHICISNDGRNTSCTRNINVLEDDKIMLLLSKINNLAIDSVISAYNCDFIDTLNYINSRFGKQIPVFFEWLMCDEDTSRQLYNFDYIKFSSNMDKLLKQVKTDIINQEYSQVVSFVLPYLRALMNPNDDNYPSCGQMRKSLNINLKGEVMACHPGMVLGTIHSDYHTMQNIYNKEINQSFSRCDCGICRFVKVCKAGCPLELPCQGKLAVCKAKKIFYSKLTNFINSFGSEIHD